MVAYIVGKRGREEVKGPIERYLSNDTARRQMAPSKAVMRMRRPTELTAFALMGGGGAEEEEEEAEPRKFEDKQTLVF